jgi:ribosome-associated protein
MSRRSRKEPDAELDQPDVVEGEAESDADEGPSRGQMKRASDEIRELGDELVALRAGLMARLSLPERLMDAISEAKRLTSHGAIRRQSQYIGKLMRHLDEETLAAVRAVIDVALGQSAKETALLHRAEYWRDLLIADDTKLEQWLAEYPATDAQNLRALIRQARKDARNGKPGEPVRQGRAYRQVFALVRTALMAEAQERQSDQ